MTNYALLVLPVANRVYASSAPRLSLAELQIFGDAALSGKLSNLSEDVLGGVPYVTFSAEGLDERDIAMLSRMSLAFALFERDGELLRPVTLAHGDLFDDDLITVQKYVGKTNEHFTKLLVNLTVLATSKADGLLSGKLRLLDPLCGRGTTLNQALMYGFDAAGIEHDTRDFEAYATFIQTWMKTKRLKHRAELGPVRRDKRTLGRRLHVTLGADKARYAAGDTLDLRMVCADTTHALDFFKPRSFDLIVTDVPYGVQHGSRSSARRLARGPLDLLSEAVPVWAQLLRPAGAVGLAWNTHVAERSAVTDVLARSSLEPVESPAHLDLDHRVDQAIHRDVVIATLPESPLQS